MRPVPASLRVASEWCWRLLILAAAAFVAATALARLRVVVVPVVAALILATALVPPARWVERRGVPRWLSTAIVFVAFLGALTGLGYLVVPALVDQFADLGPALADAAAAVERWARNGPLDLSADEVERYRSQVGAAVRSAAESGGVLSGAVAAGEVIAGTVVTLVATFFFVKDGAMIQSTALRLFPQSSRADVATAGRAAWGALGGYLRAAAFIGALEAVIIGGTVAIVGADLALPVAILTFVGGFFPIVGAIAAGLIAVLATLATGGASDALIVGGVALAVQQLDNDLLAPVIYGRAVRLHPLVVVLGITSAATLWGLTGAFLVVPAMAVAAAVTRALHDTDGSDDDDGAGVEASTDG